MSKDPRNSLPEESRSLQFLVGDVPAFFDRIFQGSCAVYSTAGDPSKQTESDGIWNRQRTQENPVHELVQQGWQVLSDLLEQKHRDLVADHQRTISPDVDELPLLFRDCTMVSKEERIAKYSFLHHHQHQQQIENNINLWAAFLDGCSVVLNHCDRQSPWIAALCEDLQLSVPHAYANAYITPAASQAVAAHADDRDVLVIQVYGRKKWRVYKNIPVPFPYPNEQVGKDAPVPEAVLQGELLVERTLEPGDCLYMPRGYVHEASACEDCCSFHVTVALATHDWTLAGLMSGAAEPLWKRQIPLRRAVDRNWGRRPQSQEAASQLQSDIDHAIQLLRDEVNVGNVETALQNKYERHNQRAKQCREPLMAAYDALATAPTKPRTYVVGWEAASNVTLQSWIRAATPEEKAQLQQRNDENAPQVGLHVRVETYDGILTLLQKLQQATPQRLDAAVAATSENNPLICPVTQLSMAKRCVELGALAVVEV